MFLSSNFPHTLLHRIPCHYFQKKTYLVSPLAKQPSVSQESIKTGKEEVMSGTKLAETVTFIGPGKTGWDFGEPLFPSPALIFLLVLLHMVINEIGIENENESFKMFGSGDLVKRKEINKMIKIR